MKFYTAKSIIIRFNGIYKRLKFGYSDRFYVLFIMEKNIKTVLGHDMFKTKNTVGYRLHIVRIADFTATRTMYTSDKRLTIR